MEVPLLTSEPVTASNGMADDAEPRRRPANKPTAYEVDVPPAVRLSDTLSFAPVPVEVGCFVITSTPLTSVMSVVHCASAESWILVSSLKVTEPLKAGVKNFEAREPETGLHSPACEIVRVALALPCALTSMTPPIAAPKPLAPPTCTLPRAVALSAAFELWLIRDPASENDCTIPSVRPKFVIASWPIVYEMPETVVVLSWRRDGGASVTLTLVPVESKVMLPRSAGIVSHGIADGRGVHGLLVASVKLRCAARQPKEGRHSDQRSDRTVLP